MIKTVLLQLGGNQGDVLQVFQEAIGMLNDQVGEVGLLSKVYESEPWGFDEDLWFLNQVLELKTELNPQELLGVIHKMEKDLGRVKRPEGTYVGRPIDIDILFYENEIVHTDELVIPHMHIRHRRFVLVPLNDHWASFVHPEYGADMKHLLERCDDTGKVRLISEDSKFSSKS